MALSMEEERILTEIASQLSDDDPALARRLARFGHVRRARRRRRGRARLVVAVVLAVVVVGAAVAVTVALAAT
jgi:type VI protein secretion system component VasF